MKDEYIKLPIIKKVEVKGYKLFKSDWKYEFKKGLNLFLGGNTLGKTTSVYIMY
jgi:predicted ATP-dependent endonuclease of OLD family